MRKDILATGIALLILGGFLFFYSYNKVKEYQNLRILDPEIQKKYEMF
ncbi:MAG: hypothetical protein QXF32_02670 [Candidatus Thermoplasmatota archaeon]